MSDMSQKPTYLSSSVHDLSGEILTFIFDNPTERVFNRWVIALDKYTIHKLNCEGRLPWR